jgi:hypothetical protein
MMFSRTRRISALPRTPRSVVVVLLLLLLQSCIANGDDEIDDSKNDKGEDDGFGEDGWILAVVMSLLFAFCFSLFGSVLGYISFLDDAIMKRYQTGEAFVVEADIYSTEFARGAGHGSPSLVGFEGNQREYCVTVKYDQIICESYRIRIRKQIRVLESDFILPDHLPDHPPELLNPKTTSGDNAKATKSLDPEAAPVVDPESLMVKDNKKRPAAPIIVVNQEKFLHDHRKLELLVLNQKPKSGFPREQLDRRLSLRYRLSSVAFVIFTIFLALFCFRRAIRFITEEEDEQDRLFGWITVWVFVALIVIQIPCIHILLHTTLRDALEEDYFELAELVPTTGQEDDDDSSSSSDSENMFLSSDGHQRSSLSNTSTL